MVHGRDPGRPGGTVRGMQIEGSIALVTGANRGLGAALTQALLVRADEVIE